MKIEVSKVTPIVLTYDEEPNIDRALDSLQWAHKVIVLDSGSTDSTAKIAAKYTNVEWHTRPFDNFEGQWGHAIHQVATSSDYVLGLDADMQVPKNLLQEIANQFLPGKFAGGLIPFDYRYYGNSLCGSLCAPQLRIFRRSLVKVTQQNHGHKFVVSGEIYRFRARLIHDDRKSIERWVTSQLKYQLQNEAALDKSRERRARDYFREVGLMPPLMGLLAYVKAGGPFKGAAAARYAYERLTAESILAIRIMNRRMNGRHD